MLSFQILLRVAAHMGACGLSMPRLSSIEMFSVELLFVLLWLRCTIGSLTGGPTKRS